LGTRSDPEQHGGVEIGASHPGFLGNFRRRDEIAHAIGLDLDDSDLAFAHMMFDEQIRQPERDFLATIDVQGA